MVFQTGIGQARLVRDHADRRRRHDVRDHALQRSHDRVRSEQQEAGLALRAQARHDASPAAGPNNRGVAVSGGVGIRWVRWTRTSSRSTRRPARSSGTCEVADPAAGYSITHAPLIVGENVIVGVSGGEYGIRGHVTAYNVETGEQAWRWYSIPAPKGDPTFDDKAPNGWWGTWATKAEDADLHRDIAKEKADSAKYGDAWKTGGGGVWMTPAYDKESQHDLRRGRQPFAGPRWQRPSGRQPLYRLRSSRSTPRPARPSGTTRRCRTMSGTSMPVSPGRHYARPARRSWSMPARPAGSTSSMRPPASWSARATTSCRRRTCSRCRPRRAPGCCRAPTAARSGRRSRWIPTSTTPSWPACTSR